MHLYIPVNGTTVLTVVGATIFGSIGSSLFSFEPMGGRGRFSTGGMIVGIVIGGLTGYGLGKMFGW